MMMKIASLLTTLLLLQPSAVFVFAQSEEEDCPLIPVCCEEDCCGVGTTYENGSCVVDPASPGWTGTYSIGYEFGCAIRACCEAACCPPGTVYYVPTALCVPTASVSGTVTGDTNNDNIGDTDLSGVPIKLLDSSGNIFATTTTDSNGNYILTDIPPGNYNVMETNIVSFPFDVSDTDLGDANMIAVTIVPGSPVDSTNNNFVDELSRVITGVVLEDLDDNNTGDVPIVGVTITLFDESGVIVGTTLTDTTGRFRFEAPPGIYTVQQTNLGDEDFADVSDTDTPALNGTTLTFP